MNYFCYDDRLIRLGLQDPIFCDNMKLSYYKDNLKISPEQNIQIDSSVRIFNPENVTFESNIRIDAHCIINAVHPVKIGNNVHIGTASQFSASGGEIIIDDFCGISSRVNIFTSTDDYSEGYLTNPTIPQKYRKVKTGKVHLQKHAIVGCGSVIMPGCTLEMGCSVGALSFVNKTVPTGKIVSGNPLRVIGNRNLTKLLLLEEEFKKEQNTC